MTAMQELTPEQMIGKVVMVKGRTTCGILVYVKGSWAGIELAGENGRVDEYPVHLIMIDPT